MRIGIACVAAALLLGACGPSASDAPPPAEKDKKGRQETQAIRNTQAIGVSGEAMANKVDKALEANDQHNQQLQDADPAATDPPK